MAICLRETKDEINVPIALSAFRDNRERELVLLSSNSDLSIVVGIYIVSPRYDSSRLTGRRTPRTYLTASMFVSV